MKVINREKEIIGDASENDNKWSVEYTWEDNKEVVHHDTDRYNSYEEMNNDWREYEGN